MLKYLTGSTNILLKINDKYVLFTLNSQILEWAKLQYRRAKYTEVRRMECRTNQNK